MEVKALLNKPLDKFTILELIEIYRINDDGQRTKSVGLLPDEIIAKAFAEAQTDVDWHKTRKVHVVTDGKNEGFLVGEIVPLLDEKKVLAEIKEKALAKLTPEERALFKL